MYKNSIRSLLIIGMAITIFLFRRDFGSLLVFLLFTFAFVFFEAIFKKEK